MKKDIAKNKFLYTKDEVDEAIDEVIAYADGYTQEMVNLDNAITNLISNKNFYLNRQLRELVNQITLARLENDGNPFRIQSDIKKFRDILMSAKAGFNNPSNIQKYQKNITDFSNAIQSALENNIIKDINKIQKQTKNFKIKALLKDLDSLFFQSYAHTADFGSILNQLLIISQNKKYEINEIKVDKVNEVIKVKIKEIPTGDFQSRFYTKKHFWFVYKLISCPNYFMPYLTLYGQENNYNNLLKDKKTTFLDLHNSVYRNTWSAEKINNVKKSVD